MPERNLTVATYAAGASLAAITLIYVFGPTFFIDGDSSSLGGSGSGSSSNRRKGVVGLSNPANDCFINSILQSLAGLGDLRVYLIRESHRRRLDGREVYRVPVEQLEKISRNEGIKLEGLRKGIVTLGLKEVLDSLNERPLHKKTISASGFVEDLEFAFRQRISRQQQDAQEFLQIVAERLCDEYHAGRKARRQWKEHRSDLQEVKEKEIFESEARENVTTTSEMTDNSKINEEKKETGEEPAEEDESEEEGFPLEGKHKSQVECLTCHFQPKPSVSSFVTLTLNVPQKNSTTLNDCFDGLFKKEYIDDYICDRCRLEHAIETFTQLQARTKDEKEITQLSSDIEKLQKALEVDPEKLPKDIRMPDTKNVPKRKISRSVKITQYPKVLAIHLSRSIFDPRSSSMKNFAKVSFPEKLTLGGLLTKKSYKLLGVVTHKGSHNSGHYESFRRQNTYPPFSTPNVFQPGGAYGQSIHISSSTASSPNIPPVTSDKSTVSRPSTSSDITTPSSSARPSSDLPPPASSASSLSPTRGPTSIPSNRDSTLSSSSATTNTTTATTTTGSEVPAFTATRPHSSTSSRLSSWTAATSNSNVKSKDKSSLTDAVMTKSIRRRKRQQQQIISSDSGRWWRISDERAKECKTADVLGMQREVYLLFYELERDNFVDMKRDREFGEDESEKGES